MSGGRTRARTWDPLIKSQLLYQGCSKLAPALLAPTYVERRRLVGQFVGYCESRTYVIEMTDCYLAIDGHPSANPR